MCITSSQNTVDKKFRCLNTTKIITSKTHFNNWISNKRKILTNFFAHQMCILQKKKCGSLYNLKLSKYYENKKFYYRNALFKFSHE